MLRRNKINVNILHNYVNFYIHDDIDVCTAGLCQALYESIYVQAHALYNHVNYKPLAQAPIFKKYLSTSSSPL